MRYLFPVTFTEEITSWEKPKEVIKREDRRATFKR